VTVQLILDDNEMEGAKGRAYPVLAFLDTSFSTSDMTATDEEYEALLAIRAPTCGQSRLKKSMVGFNDGMRYWHEYRDAELDEKPLVDRVDRRRSKACAAADGDTVDTGGALTRAVGPTRTTDAERRYRAETTNDRGGGVAASPPFRRTEMKERLEKVRW